VADIWRRVPLTHKRSIADFFLTALETEQRA